MKKIKVFKFREKATKVSKSARRMKRIRLKSVRSKLIASFLIMIALIVLSGAFAYAKASSVVMDNYKEAVSNSVAANGRYLELIMSSVESESLKYISNDNLKKYYTGKFEKNSKEEFDAYNTLYNDVLATVGGDEFIYAITIIPNGDNPISTIKNFKIGAHKDFVNSAEVQALNDSGKKFIWLREHPYIDERLDSNTGKYGASLTRCMVNTALKTIGYIVIDVKLDVMQEVLDSMDFGVNALSMFVFPDGSSIKSSYETKNGDWDIANEAFYAEILEGEDITGTFEAKYNSQEYLCSYYKLSSGNIMLFNTLDIEVIENQVSAIKKMIILFSLLAVFIATFIAMYISGDISRIIIKISKEMDKVAQGDLTVVLKNNRHDEFGDLINSISKMLTSMKELISETVEMTGSVKISAEKLNEATAGIVTSANNMGDALFEMEKGANQQAEQASDCLDEMNMLSERIEEVNKNNSYLSKIAQDAGATVNSGITRVSDLNAHINSTAGITKDIVEQIRLLSEDTQVIKSIVSLINDVAEQSNLLSFNASIEAARAGASGAGFAVVAEEIRKLAEQSLSASLKIQENIDAILERNEVMALKANEVDESLIKQQEAVDGTVSIFNEVNEKLNSFMEHMEKITDNINDVEKVKNHTLEAMSNIAAVVEETTAVTENISENARVQISLADNLSDSNETLSKNATILEEAVNKFNV